MPSQPGHADSWPQRLRSLPWPAQLALLLGVTGVMAVAIIASGGLPVPVALVGILVLVWMVHEPLVTVPLMVITQVIWLIGSYAPGGMNFLAPSKIMIALCFACWALWAMRGRVPLTYAPHMLAIGAFFLLVILGPVLTPAFEGSITGIGKYALMVLPYFLVANLGTSRRAILVIAIAISATATLSAGLALVERFMPGINLEFDGLSLGAHVDENSLDSGVAIKRVTGGIGDANWFSYTMATALPLCVYWFRAYPGLWIRAGVLLMAAMQGMGIVFSYTRTPLIGLAGATVFLLWKRKLPLAPMMIAAAIGAVSAPAWLPDGFLERFISEKYLSEGSTPMRKEIYSMAVDLIIDRPLLGHGYEQFGPEFIKRSKTEMGLEWARRDETGQEPAYLLRAHNLYLDVWVQHGIVGLALLLTAYGLLLKELAEVARIAPSRDAEMAVGIMAALLSFYLCGLGGHSQELKIFWLLAGLAAALRRVVWTTAAARGPATPP